MRPSIIFPVLFSAITAAAQNYAINWFTIDGGGGESGGAGYVLRGTIGQPDAGAMTGSALSISGGFWTDIAPTTVIPSLRIARVGPNALIAWPNPSTAFQLQEAAALLPLPGGWTDVGQTPTIVGDEKQVLVPAAMASRFYRLRKP